jgi:transcriptional regulator with XRE-family HTH domain
MQPASTNVLTTRHAEALKVAVMAAERARRIGGRIRERRDELGLKQHQLADRVGQSVTKDYVSRWERGKTDAALGPYLEQIAAALDITEADLMAGPVAERESQGEAPDLLGTLDGDVDQEQLDRIEKKVDQLLERLAPTAPQTGDDLPADEPIPPTAQPDEEDTAEEKTS